MSPASAAAAAWARSRGVPLWSNNEPRSSAAGNQALPQGDVSPGDCAEALLEDEAIPATGHPPQLLTTLTVESAAHHEGLATTPAWWRQDPRRLLPSVGDDSPGSTLADTTSQALVGDSASSPGTASLLTGSTQQQQTHLTHDFPPDEETDGGRVSLSERGGRGHGVAGDDAGKRVTPAPLVHASQHCAAPPASPRQTAQSQLPSSSPELGLAACRLGPRLSPSTLALPARDNSPDEPQSWSSPAASPHHACAGLRLAPLRDASKPTASHRATTAVAQGVGWFPVGWLGRARCAKSSRPPNPLGGDDGDFSSPGRCIASD